MHILDKNRRGESRSTRRLQVHVPASRQCSYPRSLSVLLSARVEKVIQGTPGGFRCYRFNRRNRRWRLHRGCILGQGVDGQGSRHDSRYRGSPEEGKVYQGKGTPRYSTSVRLLSSCPTATVCSTSRNLLGASRKHGGFRPKECKVRVR